MSPLFYFIFLSIFSSFFLLHTCTLTFFSLFPSFLFFPTTSSTHVPLLFFFISFFRLFPYHFTLQNIPCRAEHFLPLSISIFFLPFSLFSCHFVCKFLSLYPIKTHKLKGHTQPNHLILIKRSWLNKIYRGMRVEEDEERRRGWHESELQGKGQSREMRWEEWGIWAWKLRTSSDLLNGNLVIALWVQLI